MRIARELIKSYDNLDIQSQGVSYDDVSINNVVYEVDSAYKWDEIFRVYDVTVTIDSFNATLTREFIINVAIILSVLINEISCKLFMHCITL